MFEPSVACRFVDIFRVRVGYLRPLYSLLTGSEETPAETDFPRSTRGVSPF